MSPYALSMLISSLSAGTIITFISNHWFLAWIGLELNTLAIIPIMSKMHHPRSTEAAIKYFLIQSMASALLLFATTLNAWYTGEWTIINMQTQTPLLLLTTALMIKLAVAPFHMWLPDVIQGLDLMTCLILSTWQKLAPMTLMIQVSSEINTTLFMFLGMLSLLIGGWGGLNQAQLRKMMAYSSIAHLGWMMIVMSYSPNLTLLNLMMYLLLTTSMFLMMMKLLSTNINKMASSWMKNLSLTSTMIIILMSLGGLPPLSGFMPKWLILEEIIKQNIPLAMMAAMSTLLSLFFYLRLSYMMSLTTPPTTMSSKLMWRLKMKLNMSTTIIMSTMLLPITPLILNMI
uniref:NADH-ubiquinone oxidoreductase chain 2 n=4 Tax=Desmognathus TaxID=43045 RepID=Q644L6_9SALA|nr:NADH dehydrogenase subunit 2 [Desmognathus fuscus]AAT37325.1 NADH dehydrogenase subunit 2 [Desmognathus auriculatus]AAT37289.1 NADH dehydrogenase subunit 2 [Desmognathus fuscus]AAT37291.1 NADH dehydrogenase subunit 2 [Desmognathus fuscus]AAT37295.1 NADH dehydrogenase subunit 2 [Desmognathus fuscus]AAU20618.1 NADH dehydrogenase subunit 2 [Desmognathus fuscus]